MANFLFKKKNFVVLETQNGYIVYNQNKIWENGHTHVANLKMCRTLIDLVLTESIPKTNDLWVYESVLRICSNSQKKYIDKIIHKMDSISLQKSNN